MWLIQETKGNERNFHFYLIPKGYSTLFSVMQVLFLEAEMLELPLKSKGIVIKLYKIGGIKW